MYFGASDFLFGEGGQFSVGYAEDNNGKAAYPFSYGGETGTLGASIKMGMQFMNAPTVSELAGTSQKKGTSIGIMFTEKPTSETYEGFNAGSTIGVSD